jgi:hypothetical protein
MPVQVPSGYLVGDRPRTAQPSGFGTGIAEGLRGLGPAITEAFRGGVAGDAAYRARSLANRQRAKDIGEVTKRLTFGDDYSLAQLLQSAAGRPRGGRGGSPGLGAALQTYQAEDLARRLSGLTEVDRATEAAMAPQSPLEAAIRPRAPYERAGLANPATQLGLPSGTLLRPDTLTELAEIIRSGDASGATILSTMGLPADMGAEDFRGLAAKNLAYQSEIASRLGREQGKKTEVSLAGRTVLMKARLVELGYKADNLNEVAAELARLPDEAAAVALGELGRPTKFGHELALAKRRSVKTVIQRIVHEGLSKKGPSGTSGGTRSAKELGDEVHDLRENILKLQALAGKPADEGGGLTPSQAKSLAVMERDLEISLYPKYLAQLGVERRQAREGGKITFTDWYKGMDARKQRDFDASLVESVRAHAAGGGSEKDWVSAMGAGDRNISPLLRTEDAKAYLGQMFRMTSNPKGGLLTGKNIYGQGALGPEPPPETVSTTISEVVAPPEVVAPAAPVLEEEVAPPGSDAWTRTVESQARAQGRSTVRWLNALADEVGGGEEGDTRREEAGIAPPVDAINRRERGWGSGPEVAHDPPTPEARRADSEITDYLDSSVGTLWETLREVDRLSRLDKEGDFEADDIFSDMLNDPDDYAMNNRPPTERYAIGSRTQTAEIRKMLDGIEEDIEYLNSLAQRTGRGFDERGRGRTRIKLRQLERWRSSLANDSNMKSRRTFYISEDTPRISDQRWHGRSGE